MKKFINVIDDINKKEKEPVLEKVIPNSDNIKSNLFSYNGVDVTICLNKLLDKKKEKESEEVTKEGLDMFNPDLLDNNGSLIFVNAKDLKSSNTRANLNMLSNSLLEDGYSTLLIINNETNEIIDNDLVSQTEINNVIEV